jgi:prepilin-type N-terminal cleavage/methylation domain-containing protein
VLKNKKAFTLFELLIGISLISIIYMFAINSFSNNSKLSDEKISLDNLKQFLLKQEFNNNIKLQCIDEDFTCFVSIDKELQENKTNPLFEKKPTIYNYTQRPETIEFKSLELENLDSFDIIFEFECKRDGKCDELVVETQENGVYIFNNIHKKPFKIGFINDIDLYFQNKIDEVKDAF